MKYDEIDSAKAALKKEKNPTRKQELARYLTAETSRLKSFEDKELQEQVRRERKKKEFALVSHGKRPYYLKKNDLKDIVSTERTKKDMSHLSTQQIEKRLLLQAEKRDQRREAKRHRFKPE